MPDKRIHSGAWDDEADEADKAAAFQPLTRAEAQALRDRQPQVPVWWVVAAQAAMGGVVALAAGLLTGDTSVFGSALYGAAVVVVPGALMARGMSSRLSSVSPGASAVSFMLWELVKIAVSVLMLALAPKIVQPLSWPALLVSLVVCLNVYLLALLWRRPAKKQQSGT
jgi:ATP synthase protein I